VQVEGDEVKVEEVPSALLTRSPLISMSFRAKSALADLGDESGYGPPGSLTMPMAGFLEISRPLS
jgi:hypothetical protein